MLQLDRYRGRNANFVRVADAIIGISRAKPLARLMASAQGPLPSLPERNRRMMHDRLRMKPFILSEAPRRDFIAARRARLLGIALMCGAVAMFACLDTT